MQTSHSKRLAVALVTAIMFAAAGSHLLVRWLGIETTAVRYRVIGPGDKKPLAYSAGSSLMLFGLSWPRICGALGQGIENHGIPGGSPAEWEGFQERSPEARLTFLVVSTYDLNEHFLCDFRAEVTPLWRSVLDLWRSRSDWEFSKRVLGRYALRYVRIFFPTAGRSQGVMTGVRAKLKALLQKGGNSAWDDRIGMSPDEGPSPIKPGRHIGDILNLGKDDRANTLPEEIEGITEKTSRVSEVSEARILRRLALYRASCVGRWEFNGPKKLAFERMLRQANSQGEVVVVVLPVAPILAREFLSPEVMHRFESAIADLRRSVPQARWCRLDNLERLNSDDLFLDFEHLNANGKQIATAEFLAQLRQLGLVP